MKRFVSNVECSKGSSGGDTVVPFKRGVACTLMHLQSSRLMIINDS